MTRYTTKTSRIHISNKQSKNLSSNLRVTYSSVDTIDLLLARLVSTINRLQLASLVTVALAKAIPFTRSCAITLSLVHLAHLVLTATMIVARIFHYRIVNFQAHTNGRKTRSDSPILVSQYCPVNSGRHRHTALLPALTHLPLFLHGLFTQQGSTTEI